MTTAAVVSIGAMGPGIAATLCRAGMKVTTFDVSAEQRAKAAQSLKTATGVLANLGVPDRSNGAEVRIAETLEDCVKGVDVVVETVPEKLEIKAKVFQEIDKAAGKTCIIASNTSGIPITKLQAGNSAPGRVVGMHWSNPPHIIPMIEVIAGNESAPATVSWLVDTIKGLVLLAVVVQKDVPGFVENRILYALLRECVDLVEKGVIDAAGLDTCVSWGIGYKLSVIGPMALLDMAGLDIYQAVGSYLNKELCNRGDVSGYVTERTASGKLGMKTKGGIFSYTPERIAELQGQRARKLVGVRKALES
jgi:3-hydroxybutyryl-CoA dehydrogenase/5-formyl-3-hydroxy-2-methylpyridine 4-carboxylate dehydrogenase